MIRTRAPSLHPLVETLEPRLLLSALYPDLQNVDAPADDPSLPAAR